MDVAEKRIEDYALLGDTRTAALLSRSGSIDWMCAPTFGDSPLFGALVDDRGGSFSIDLGPFVTSRRRYEEGSAVVRSEVQTATAVVRTVDGMVANVRGSLLPRNLLVRHVVCDSGRLDARIRFDPRLGLPGRIPGRVRRSARGLICEWGSLAVGLSTTPDVDIRPGGSTIVTLAEGDAITFVLSVSDRCPISYVPAGTALALLEETTQWWRGWSAGSSYEGPHRDAVSRSLLTLRLLTYSPSGAPVASPTTSLPEAVGAARNWDYRYAWPRDAAIGVAAFLGAGNSSVADSFMHWLLHASRLSRPRLRVLYDIYGKPAPKEREIDATGFRGSRPVRVGNGARAQHQLDVYGWVIDAAWLFERSGGIVHGEMWRAVAGFGDFAARKWDQPDAGIWEVRGEPAHYVHSKAMAWLALDRVTRMANRRRVKRTRLRRWVQARDSLARWIRDNGIDRDRTAFVWRSGGKDMDASLLLLPVIGLEPVDSPLVAGTVEAIRQDLEVAPGLLLRYPRGADTLEGDEGAFLPCSFWLVQALALMGRVEEAAELFEMLLSLGNDVGLFGEEVDPITKEPLGNFPQAFTHAAVVQAALSLQAAQAPRLEAS